MLEVDNVKMQYGDFVAVKNLQFTIKPGEIFGLLGTNGAGKTTTFRVIMGLLAPTQGEVRYFGEAIGYHNVDEIGYMIEERSLLTKITVKDYLTYMGRLKSMDTETIRERIDTWLERFEITDYKDKLIKELSKGNQQKIQFIAAIINDPKLLVLDEPFSGLDPINTELFMKVIRQFQAEGKMIVFSSHQLDHVESFCENIVVLEKGEALIEGHISQVKRDFKKQRIRVDADIKPDVFKAIDGVYDVIENKNGLIVKIESEAVVPKVFAHVKAQDTIKRFEVEDAALSEIFIAKVRERREQV